jgi:hypothetical protein
MGEFLRQNLCFGMDGMICGPNIGHNIGFSMDEMWGGQNDASIMSGPWSSQNDVGLHLAVRSCGQLICWNWNTITMNQTHPFWQKHIPAMLNRTFWPLRIPACWIWRFWPQHILAMLNLTVFYHDTFQPCWIWHFLTITHSGHAGSEVFDRETFHPCWIWSV